MREEQRRRLLSVMLMALYSRDEMGDRNIEVYWKEMEGIDGTYTAVINLHPDCDAVSTLVHEMLHYLKPLMKEEKVRELEEELYKGMTRHERRLFKDFLKKEVLIDDSKGGRGGA